MKMTNHPSAWHVESTNEELAFTTSHPSFNPINRKALAGPAMMADSHCLRRNLRSGCRSFFASLIVLALAVSVQAQKIGTDVCACSPAVYEFTYDFSIGACPDGRFPSNEGAAIGSCTFFPLVNPISSLTPVLVTSVSVFELDMNGNVIWQASDGTALSDGDKYQYTSISAQRPPINDVNEIPAAIQVQSVAENSFGEQMLSIYLIDYSNDCNVYPVLVDGVNQVGWTDIGTLEPPIPELCPAAASPSLPPSQAPKPTPVPTSLPTMPPSDDFSMSMNLQRTLLDRELQEELILELEERPLLLRKTSTNEFGRATSVEDLPNPHSSIRRKRV